MQKQLLSRTTLGKGHVLLDSFYQKRFYYSCLPNVSCSRVHRILNLYGCSIAFVYTICKTFDTGQRPHSSGHLRKILLEAGTRSLWAAFDEVWIHHPHGSWLHRLFRRLCRKESTIWRRAAQVIAACSTFLCCGAGTCRWAESWKGHNHVDFQS